MNAVRATIPSSEVARSVGITTGNFMLKDGFRGYVSHGPRLQANDPEPVKNPDENKIINVVYNDGKCYKCGTKDFDILRVYFAGAMGKCRKCTVNFVISSQMSQKEYEEKFSLK
jgi:hypothetical protein